MRLAPVLQSFFTDRLVIQRQASPATIAAYRDTFRLLLAWLAATTGTQPATVDLGQLDVTTISAFLTYLQDERGNSTSTRNARLTAIRSLFHHAALHAPEHAESIARVLAIPPKRCDRTLVSFLTAPEIEELLAAPDRDRWHGRRDHALLALACQTGLRVSELTALTRGDVHTGEGAHVRCSHGKGRKQRHTPLTRQTVTILTIWNAERKGGDDQPLFPTRSGTALSRDAIARLVTKHAATAARSCPSIAAKNVTPHTLRHSAAMALLHVGIDTSVIALWMGHASPESTQAYLHADMTIKQRALARVTPPNTAPGRYKAPDALLAYLDTL
jgi:integrase/recombinase XerD